VAQSSTFEIKSIQDAIDKRLTICADSTNVPTLTADYPGVNKWYSVTDPRLFPVFMHESRCDASVLSEQVMVDMHSGYLNSIDCAANSNSTDYYCVRDSDGAPSLTRDCKFQKVGDIVSTNQVSFPLSRTIANSLSFSIVKRHRDGAWAASINKYQAEAPQSQCTTDAPTTQKLPFSSFYGTMFISSCIMAMAVVAACIEIGTGRSIEEMLGFASRPDQEPEATNGSPELDSKSTEVPTHFDVREKFSLMDTQMVAMLALLKDIKHSEMVAMSALLKDIKHSVTASEQQRNSACASKGLFSSDTYLSGGLDCGAVSRETQSVNRRTAV